MKVLQWKMSKELLLTLYFGVDRGRCVDKVTAQEAYVRKSPELGATQ